MAQWRHTDTQRVIRHAEGLTALTTADRCLLLLLLSHTWTFKATGEVVAMIDKRMLARLSGLSVKSVENGLARLRKCLYVGEWTYMDKANGWRQYGYKLGPACFDEASLTASLLAASDDA